ncbi:hypothetical protein ACIA7S_28510 [Streptomyces sp. NPDC051643]|uniref:hypothetical protein n=1 Tax=Streptomyces sp. NPDC051643 TaxID=3365665 RepID=UPI00379723D0
MSTYLVAAALVAAATAVCALGAAWWIRRRMVRLLAAAADRQTRQRDGARAEVDQLRRSMRSLLADDLVLHEAAAVVDDALRVMSAPETGR